MLPRLTREQAALQAGAIPHGRQPLRDLVLQSKDRDLWCTVIPDVDRTEQPLPFRQIHARPPLLGPFSETILLLGLLLIGYLAMLWVARSSDQDLPARAPETPAKPAAASTGAG